MTAHSCSRSMTSLHCWLIAAGIACLCSAYYVLTWRSFVTVIGVCAKPFCDFVDYYYPMGEAVFRTGVPVPGFLYSPFIAMILAVFPPLGLHASLLLWGVLQVSSVLLLFFLFRRLVPAGFPVQLLFLALTLAAFPLAFNFMAGQVSVFIVAAMFGMLVLYRRGYRVAAAILFALAVSIKFYPIIFLASFIARRDAPYLLLATVACGVFLFVMPGGLLGFGDTLRFYGALLDAFRSSDWVVTNIHSQYFPHVIARLAEAAGFAAQGLIPPLRWAGFAVAAANMGFIYRIQRARLRHVDLWSFQLVFLTIPFVLKTSWPHDFVFLPFAQALLTWWLLEGDEVALSATGVGEGLHSGNVPVRTSPTRTAVAYSLVTSIVISNVVFFNLLGDFSVYGYLAFLLWADLLLLGASYLVLLPAVRPNTVLTTSSVVR